MTTVTKNDHFVGIRVPGALVSEIDSRAGRGGLSRYVRAALIEKLAREEHQPVA